MAGDAGGSAAGPPAGGMSEGGSGAMSLEMWRRLFREDPGQAERRISDEQGDPERLKDLARALLQDPDPDLRAWACRILAETPDASGVALLRGALEDPDPGVRAAAAWALGARPRASMAEEVLLALQRRLEDLPWVAWVAAEALARYGEAALSVLVESLQHPHPQVRILAARALARIASPHSVPALFAALEDPSLLVRRFAEAGLDRLLGLYWVG